MKTDDVEGLVDFSSIEFSLRAQKRTQYVLLNVLLNKGPKGGQVSYAIVKFASTQQASLLHVLKAWTPALHYSPAFALGMCMP